MLPKLIVAVVVEAFHGGVLDRAVHPLNLTIRPRMARLRETVLDVEVGVGALEGVAAEQHLLGPHRSDSHRVQVLPDSSVQEVAGDPAHDLLVQLGEGELGGPVDRHEQVKPAFFGVHLGNIDVDVADRVTLELCS